MKKKENHIVVNLIYLIKKEERLISVPFKIFRWFVIWFFSRDKRVSFSGVTVMCVQPPIDIVFFFQWPIRAHTLKYERGSLLNKQNYI